MIKKQKLIIIIIIIIIIIKLNFLNKFRLARIHKNQSNINAISIEALTNQLQRNVRLHTPVLQYLSANRLTCFNVKISVCIH